MPEVMNKVVDLVAAQPLSVITVLAAVALLCIVVTPILSLAFAGYVVRVLVRRPTKGESR